VPNPRRWHPFRYGDRKVERLRQLQRRFRRISRQAGLYRPRRRYRSVKVIVFIAVVVVLAFHFLVTSPWPIGLTLRHLAAAPNCAAARAVGLAPARKGEPGYCASHDRDGDGIACEVWRR
jgi:hypothetical protein